MEIPDEWEMLQFTRSMNSGRIAFADRYQFRIEFNWRVVDGPPDFDRMMSDYEGRLKEDPGTTRLEQARFENWRGLDCLTDGALFSRFGCFFKAESCLVEIVFVWPSGKDASLEAKVLRSVKEEPPSLDRFRRWSAFGMDWRASKDLAFHECLVEPASVYAAFRNAKGNWRESFQRLGMLSEWLHTSVETWLKHQVPKGVHIESSRSVEIKSHTIEIVQGCARRGILTRLLTRPRNYRAAAWICPRDGRLYHVEEDTVFKQDPLDLVGIRLSCCDELTESTR